MEGDAYRLGEMPDGKASQRERDLLAPRKYQLEILAEARQRNTIAYLETGTGKTLISVLLIKALSADLRKRNGRKLAAFIVPLVPLVHQQAEVIRVHTDLRVGHYYGDMGVDFWKAERWAEEIEKNQVLVCTAQVLLNALRHGFLTMAQLRLLIVDECHHAHGRHPYRQIFTEFYHAADVADRPAVFGMTASPVNTQGVTDLTDCARQMAALERTLDCTIFALEDRDSIETFAPTPNEIVLHYDSEGVVDSGLMRRLQKLIHRAEKAGEEEKRRAAEAERKKVEAEAEEKRAETERKEEEAEAEQKRAEAEAGAGGAGEGDGEGGKAATPASMSGTESTTREDELDAEQNEQEKEPVKPEEQLMAERSGSLYGGRTDGNSGRAMTAAEALATSGAATGPGMAEVVKEEGRKEGRGEAAENGEEGAKNDEGNEKLEENVTEAVWRGAEPIGAEAGKLAARLLSRVKHTWEELGQFCAFKATERLLAQLSKDAAADALVLAGLDVGRARHERAVQRWFLGHARTLLECDASELQEDECDLPRLIEGGLLSPKVGQLLRQLNKYHFRNRRHVWAALCRHVDKIRATPEPEDARTAVDAPFPPGGPTNTSELPPKKVTEGASGSNQAPAPDEGFGGLGNPPPPGASPEDSRSQTVDSQDMPGEDEKVTGNLGDPPLPGGSPEDSRSETVDSQDMPGGDEEVTGDEDRPESAKCIVFVSRVLTAQVLTDLLTTMTSMGGLRAAALTGHSKWSRNVKTQIGVTPTDAQLDALVRAGSMNSREQQRIIARFQTSHVSLLFATDVAEEGLDIQRCNSVIRFDLPTTVRGHIQSRGRARRPGSDYVLMVERHNDAQEAMLVAIQASEALMRQQAEDRMAREDIESCLEAPEAEPEVYVVDGTGARASSDSAVGLLHRYCAKLPGDQFTVLRPQFEYPEPSPGRFSCTITLPINARIRTVEGPERASRAEAKRAAAMEAIRQLHNYKALTDRLLPSTKLEDEEIPARRPFRFTRWHYPAPKPNLPVYDEERPTLLHGKWLGQSMPRNPAEMSSSRTAESRSGTPENRAGSEVSSAPREEPRKGVKEVGMFEVSWGTEWGVQALGVVIPVFERNGTEETERILEQLKASLVEDNGAAPGDLPRRGTPEAESGHRAQGSGSEKSVEDTGAVQLETAVPSAGETLKRQATTPEPERGSADDGEKRQAARSKPAGSGGMGGTEAELPSGTASTRGLRGPDTIAVHSYSITFRSGEGADPEEADAGGYVLVTEKNLDAILPMSVEVYLPRGEEVETVLGDLGFGGRQYLSKSQLDAARQYHVKLMGWVLDWEHVTPPVEPYWSPEKAYLVLPLKEETAPKTATEEAVHTSDLPAEEPGGNKGDETGVEIDWAVVYDAVRPAKEPTPLTDGEGLGVSDSQESRDRPKEGAPVQSESEAPAPFVFSAGTEKTKEPKVEVKEPSVPIEWVAPGQLMTADGLVDVSELREGETLVTAIHTKKEYRLFRVLTDTCLDSPFIYRHREERREWTTFSEYYRTKRKLAMSYPRQPLLQCKPLKRARGLLNPHRDPYKWAPQDLVKPNVPPTDETVPGASTPVPDEPRAERPGDAPDGGSEREETYDEGQAVAEAAALLKPKLEKKEKITSEQEAEEEKLDAAADKESRRLLEVPAELCVVRALSTARAHRGAQRLPSFLHRLEEVLLAEKLRRKTGSNVHATKILEALTATSCAAGYSYERLEMLGDAYLKFAVRRHLFFAHPEQHEGWLTATFDTTVSNDALYARALERGLQGFLLTRAFDLRNWHAAGRAPPRGKPKREKKKRVPRYKKWQKMREEAAAARARAAGSETTSGVPKVGEKDEVGDTAASDIKAKNDEKGDSAASEKAAEDNERKRKYGAEERQEKESETKKRKEGSVEETARVVTNDEGGETLLELGENKEKHDGKQFQAKGGMKAGAETQSLQAESDGGRDGKDNEKVPTAKLDDAAAARAQDETRGAAEDEARAARNEYEAAIEEAELSSEEEGEIEEEGSGSDEDADEENEEQGDPNEVENNEEEKNEEEENEEEENGEKEGAASTAYEAKFPVGMSSPKAKATGLETIPEDGTGETGERSVESANGGKSLANKATNPALIGAELSEKVEAEGEVRLVKQDGIENDSKEPASGSKASGSSQSGGGQGYGGARRAAVGRARLNSRQGFGGTAGKAAAGAAKAEEQREGFGDFILGGQVLGRKLLADMVEALIGVHHVEGGPAAAEDFMRYMGLPVDLPPGDITESPPYQGLLDVRARAPPEATAVEARRAGLENLEDTIGYRFKRMSLLLEAMTHPSYMETSHVACYQRLEFLGDALIDWIITRHFFDEHKDISPGVLTYLRQAAVNNERFARLCLRFGFQRHLRHGSSDLLRHVTEFARVAAAERDPDLGSAAFGIATVHAPKVLGDLVESVAAAVLLDSELDHDQVWKVFRRLMQPIVTPETLRVHPVRELQERAQRRSLDIEYASAKVGTMFRVDISLDGERVASGTGMRVDAARKVAAKEALDYLQSVEEAEVREGRALPDLTPEERKRRRGAIRLKLREECIKRGWPRPRYFEVVKEGSAPSFRYGYEARVIFEEQTVACAAGEVLPSLKRAKQSAALLLVQKLREESGVAQNA